MNEKGDNNYFFSIKKSLFHFSFFYHENGEQNLQGINRKKIFQISFKKMEYIIFLYDQTHPPHHHKE